MEIAETRTYAFGYMEFTDQEIDQIVTLVQMFTQGRLLPVSRKSFTGKVVTYALHWKLLVIGDKGKETGKLCFPVMSGSFDVRYDIPVEALWRLVKPMLSEADAVTGYSIVNHPGWSLLNIYPQKSRHASERDLVAKFDILVTLSTHHYINFQCAGDVWSIYREEKGNDTSCQK